MPFYGRLNTVPAFTKMAGRFALIRKAIVELRKAENFFLGGTVTTSKYKEGLQEMADFSDIVANEASKALAVVANIRKKVVGYERELSNAIG